MIWSAFVIGLVGSLHCIGMCGPIVFVLPGASDSRREFIVGRVLYNMGRAVTYALLGAVVGVLGQFVALAGYQQVLGIVAGVLMILSVVIPSNATARFFPSQINTWTAGLKTRLGNKLSAGSTRSMFLIGILNGLLPCGLVYAALAASLAAGSIQGSATYMFVFGLGTVPMLFALSYASGLISGGLRRKVARIIPVTIGIMGVFFLLRGLALGIPFISPNMEKMLSKGKPHAARVSPAPSSAPLFEVSATHQVSFITNWRTRDLCGKPLNDL